MIWSGSVKTVAVGAEPEIRKLFRKRYTAVFVFESFQGDPDQLFITLMGWLQAQVDCNRDELGDPEFDAEKNNQDSFDVEISLQFEDDVLGYKDAGNPGQYILVDEAEINTAEGFELKDMAIDCG